MIRLSIFQEFPDFWIKKLKNENFYQEKFFNYIFKKTFFSKILLKINQILNQIFYKFSIRLKKTTDPVIAHESLNRAFQQKL